jgi:hypothetical protein
MGECRNLLGSREGVINVHAQVCGCRGVPANFSRAPLFMRVELFLTQKLNTKDRREHHGNAVNFFAF